MSAVAIHPCRLCGKNKPDNEYCGWCAGSLAMTADEEYATHAIAEVYR